MQWLKDALEKLTNPIHEAHVQECDIQGLLPLRKIPLTQQKIVSTADALERAIKIEAMARYPGNNRAMGPQGGLDLSQMQNQLAALTEKIQE
jgi:hypothetical protein|uniref:Uncharacterized protein n=1 Tax=Picea glauca TaxID=3330 RepID=A0A101LVP5_PICGL|nr:hypothetical protein ABT39_MTgene1733 [Picea glauca]KUM48743.1 hypothetical protein ABT39_MTgene4758 [Picea glauca]QHR89623.1 hypothetical protein Q903MT_gene3645 [Picea sitchensis]